MDEPVFERVLVAVGPGRQSQVVLAAAARIAARLGSDLIGLFVEDESWLRLAELPGATVITTASGRRALDTTTLERALRRARAEAENVLEHAAASLGIHTTFRVLRGVTDRSIAASLERGDLLVLEHSELGHALQSAVAGSEASILCLDPADADSRSIAVAFDPSEAGSARLAAATRLAAAAECELTVLPRLLLLHGAARPADLAAREPRTILALSSADFSSVQSGSEQAAIVRLRRRSLLVLR